MRDKRINFDLKTRQMCRLIFSLKWERMRDKKCQNKSLNCTVKMQISNSFTSRKQNIYIKLSMLSVSILFSD